MSLFLILSTAVSARASSGGVIVGNGRFGNLDLNAVTVPFPELPSGSSAKVLIDQLRGRERWVDRYAVYLQLELARQAGQHSSSVERDDSFFREFDRKSIGTSSSIPQNGQVLDQIANEAARLMIYQIMHTASQSRSSYRMENTDRSSD